MKILKVAHGHHPQLEAGEFSWEAEFGDDGTVKITIIDENHECSPEDRQRIFEQKKELLGPMVEELTGGSKNTRWVHEHREPETTLEEEPSKTSDIGDFEVKEEAIGESPF